MKSKRHLKPSNKKKSTQKKKYPLRGKPVVYHAPLDSSASSDWESANNASAHIPGVDKGKEVIQSGFDEPLSEFEI